MSQHSVISFWQPVLEPETKAYLAKAVDSNFLNDGPLTRQFEEEVAKLSKTRFAVATTSGTSALFLGLKACGIGPGDEVLVPDITFIATANAVRLAGAIPVLVDVDLETFNISPETARRAVTPRTRAILPVHVTGRAAAMTNLMALAKEFGLFVIEDAAEALGGQIDGKPLGSIGNLGCFSFSPNKTITTGQGGMVVTNDNSLHQRLIELKDQGRSRRGTGGDDEHASLGFNFKFTDLQAAVGLAQMKVVQSRFAHLRHVWQFYREQLVSSPALHFPKVEIERGECPQWFDLRVENRDSLFRFLVARNIHPRKFWFPIHTQVAYRQSGESFPVSIQVSREAMWLPSGLTLTDDDLMTVCKAIKAWVQ